MLSSLTTFFIVVKQAYPYDCSKYQSCYNETINSTTSDKLICSGAQTCDNSWIKSYELFCDGYGSCSNSTTITYGYQTWATCAGYGSCIESYLTVNNFIGCNVPYSCSGSYLNASGDGSPGAQCSGLHACVNTIFTSAPSYGEFQFQKDRTLYIMLGGVFSSYNSTIYSNGNNVYVLSDGYYAGYGLTIYCNGTYDTCMIQCYGRDNCVGLKIICNGYDVRCIRCIGNQCDSKTKGDFDDSVSESSYHEMVDLIDNIINVYDSNYGISPIAKENNLRFTDWINTDGYCKNTEYLFTNYSNYKKYKNNNDNIYNDNICCLASNACSNMKIIGENSNQYRQNWTGNISFESKPNLYCGGFYSCSRIAVRNINNVYSESMFGLYDANVTNFDGIVICSGEQSCKLSTISHGNVVACIAEWSCTQAIINNVSIVIGLGFEALSSVTLIDVKTVIIAGYYYPYDSKGSNISNQFDLYCQIDTCQQINLTSVFHCYNVTAMSIELTISRFGTYTTTTLSANNLTDLQHCSTTQEPTSFPTISPSVAPTLPPTISPTKTPLKTPTYSLVEEILTLFEKATVTFGIILVILSIVLIAISISLRQSKHSKTMEKYQTNILMTKYKRLLSDDHDESKTKSMSYSKEDVDTKKSASKHKKHQKHKETSVISYVSGFGQTSSHLVIAEMLFEIYDIYTDFAYSIQLYNHEHNMPFTVFLTSIGLTLIANCILLTSFVHNSFQSTKFRKWFWKYSGKIMFLLCFCLLTDACIVVTLFTSQIFGHALFYSPLDVNNIKQIKIAAFLSIFIEHLPQLGVVTYVLFFSPNNIDNKTPVSIASFIVSIVDLFVTIFKMIVWLVATKGIK